MNAEVFFVAVYEFRNEFIKGKNLYVFRRQPLVFKDVVEKEFNIGNVYECKVKPGKHEYQLRVPYVLAFKDFLELEFQDKDFFPVKAPGNFNKDNVVVDVDIKYAGRGIYEEIRLKDFAY